MYIYEPKFPEDVFDYEADFSAWLDGDQIVGTPVFTVDQGSVTVSNILTNGTQVTFWLSGGVTGENCVMDCVVQTMNGQTGVEQLQILIN